MRNHLARLSLYCFALCTHVTLTLTLSSINSDNNIVNEGNQILNDFYHRYNTTKQVDLVFVLDRSGSVPLKGWQSMLSFVRKVLEHFTVDRDNTRVAVVTYSTTAQVDINDLGPPNGNYSENKCTLFSRLKDRVEPKVPRGYTATSDALNKTFNILLNSRPAAKKAVLVLTDGKSNIGAPPVKIAVDILSLHWDVEWDQNTLGPQIEIYAFGIEHAYLPELRSVASHLPKHAFLIPKFSQFEDLARSLHGGLQEENWVRTNHNDCDVRCNSTFALCMCGSMIGVTQCVCQPGYQLLDGFCSACPMGYYKGNFLPENCRPCPENMTTRAVASQSEEDCYYLPGHRRCDSLPDIQNGKKFQVTGSRRDEVLNTGVMCDDVKDGNSCHYECDVGFRLSGPPVMICNQTGMWEGIVPGCNAVDCHSLESVTGGIEGGDVTYLDNRTLYNARTEVTCQSGRVPMPGITSWTCDRHGRWTIPANFKCEEVYCSPLELKPFMNVTPVECAVLDSAHGTTCNLTCDPGFELQGGSHYHICDYRGRSVWLPQTRATCQDIQKPVITCPDDVEVTVAHINDQSTLVLYDWIPKTLTDNSNDVTFSVENLPADDVFPVGHTELKFTATDGAGLTAACSQDIHVMAKTIENTYCPNNMELTGAARRVHFEDPEFVGVDGEVLSYTCLPANGTVFLRGTTPVLCYHVDHPDVQCKFNVTIKAKTCPPPDMTPPPHGSIVCGTNKLFQYVCRVMCEYGYSMKGLETQEYRCRQDGKWNPPFHNIPKCARTLFGLKMTMGEDIHIRYPGSCEDNKPHIKTAFETTMAAVLTNEFGPCAFPHTCQVRDINIQCGSSRRRRTSHKRLVRRDVDNETQIRFVFVISREADSFNSSHPEMTKTDQDHLHQTLMTVVNNVTHSANDNILKFDVNGVEAVSIGAAPDLESVTLPLNCTSDQMTVVNSDDIETLLESYCLICSPGTFLQSGSCQPCPSGMYQAEEGQDHCDICPSNTITHELGAWNISQCKARCASGSYSESGYEPCIPVCPSGTSSSTGVEPCSPCAVGSYQQFPHQTFCYSCPTNTTTATTGGKSYGSCGVLCEPNTFSRTGVQPCQPCPPGTYQPLEGQTTQCQVCDYLAMDQKMLQWCPDPVECSDYNTPCVHGFCVVSHTNRTQCICQSGFHGDACELDIDECRKALCLNGGTCQDGINSYTCNCTSGFEGVRCERYVGQCVSQPCLNSGSCIDKNETYQCVCSPGFNGTHCELELDPCESNPCSHGFCTKNDTQYSCVCDGGYAGFNCDKAIDYCSNFTCLHGGTCLISGSDAECACPTGFSGPNCNKKVDHCTPDPCQNLGRCINAANSFHCVCPNGLYGRTCVQSADPNFDIMFSGDTDAYVSVPVWDSLTELTVCLWLRSSEKYNFGTLFSYAAVSNWLSTSFEDVLTLYDLNDLAIVVNGDRFSTQLELNDGHWHHICVTWDGESGKTQVYINGTARVEHVLAKHTTIETGGQLVLGQRQLGRFDQYFIPSGSYKGEISQFHMFSSVLEPPWIQELSNQSACHSGQGDVISWTNVLSGLHHIKPVEQSLCLDDNECLLPGVCGDEERCIDVRDGYECQICSAADCPGYKPDDDHCSSSPCLNAGTCVAIDNSFRCECPAGLTGQTCDLLDSTCSSVTCHNHGRCRQVTEGVRCDCQPAWRGRYCEISYEPTCDEEPCLNGTCVSENSSYRCVCPEDGRHYGSNCELLSPCELDPQPCIDGATCAVLENVNVTCICPLGFPGDDCRYKPTTTMKTTTVFMDHCLNVECDHGTCLNVNNSFQCQCEDDYTGLYCDVKRQTETRRYDITVNIKKQYNPGLIQNEAFKADFRQQVHKVYSDNIHKGILRVEINQIRPGSVEVDFSLYHTVYMDAVSPNPKEMRDVLYKELENNKLGEYTASLYNFKFNYKDGGLHWAIYLVIAFVAITVLLVLIAGVYVVLRRRAMSGPKKLNNMPLVEINRVENPAFEPDSGPPTPQMRSIQDDNVYSDLGEPTPYAVDLCSGGKGSDPDLRRPFPSKKGREINKDWDNIHRQSIPLPPKPGEGAAPDGREECGYLLPCKGNPPPSYNDVHNCPVAVRYGRNNLNTPSDFIAPMSAVEERFGLDEDVYLKPTEHLKDNRTKAQAANLQLYINAPEKPVSKPDDVTYLPLLPSPPAEDAKTSTEGEQPKTETVVDSQREDSPEYLCLQEPASPRTEMVEKTSDPEERPTVSNPPKPIIRDIQQPVDHDDLPPNQPAPPIPPPDSPPACSPPSQPAPPVPTPDSPLACSRPSQPAPPIPPSASPPTCSTILHPGEFQRSGGKGNSPANAVPAVCSSCNDSTAVDTATELDKAIPVVEEGVTIYAIRKES